MGLYQLSPIVQATHSLHFVLYLIGQSGEKVDACDAFHVVDGLHVIAFRTVVSFITIDKTDSFWPAFHTQHHLKERLWNSYLILSDGFMFAFHQHRASNNVDATILFSPFSALSFQLFPIANVQLMVLRTYISEQKRLLLCNCIPRIVGRRAKVSAVVATFYVVCINSSWFGYLLVFLKANALTLVGSFCMFGC